MEIIGETCLIKYNSKKKVEEILKFHPKIKCIVREKPNSRKKYRFPKFNLIYGKMKEEMKLKENGIIYYFNLKKCYFTIKNSEIKKKILKRIKEKTLVGDYTCGFGSFGIFFLKNKKIKVLFNDYNKSCLKYLEKNLKLNKLEKKNYKINSKNILKSKLKKVNYLILNFPFFNFEKLNLEKLTLKFGECFIFIINKKLKKFLKKNKSFRILEMSKNRKISKKKRIIFLHLKKK